MDKKQFNEDYLAIISPLLSASGMQLVDLSVKQLSGMTQVVLVVTQESGLTIGDCSKLAKLIKARIEMQLDVRDLSLEVSSPGIDRVLKSAGEFSVFLNREVRVLLKDSNEWLKGLIVFADEQSVQISCNDNIDTIKFDDIQKAKLVYSGGK